MTLPKALSAPGETAFLKPVPATLHSPVPSFKLGGTIKNTGAGDTFCAGVLNFVLEHGISCLTVGDRKNMPLFANAAASIVTTRRGAIRSMPERSEVEDLLAADQNV